jgi:hypothetical protein
MSQPELFYKDRATIGETPLRCNNRMRIKPTP